MNTYETATVTDDERPLRGTFPREWGRPPADEEQRAGWIQAKIRCGEIARQFGEEVRWLGHTSPVRVPSSIVARRIAQMRLHLLELRARWPQ